MYKGFRFLAVIPARGGSKGLPRKNIRMLDGKPLLSYSILQSLSVPYIDATVVSSEDEEILNLAQASGAEAIRRPDKLAGDKARTEDALIHALNTLKDQGRQYHFVVTLEPTHPLRNPNTIKRAIEMVVNGKHDSLLTLTPDHTDFWRKKGKSYSRLFPNAPRRRQDREPLFKENSLIYITASSTLIKRKFVLGVKPAIMITAESESLDIHTATDLAMAESFLKNKNQMSETTHGA